MSEEAVPRSVLRFANGCLYLAAAILGSLVVHALAHYKSKPMAAVAAVLALLVLACRRLAPERRVKAALSIVPSLAVIFAFDLVIGLRSPAPASAAARAGRSWDSRPMGDILHDLRSEGKDAWPSARPRMLYKDRRRGLDIGGKEALPLGGIAGVTTILCNEGGTWSVYQADEHGFNNPRGLWSGEVELALVGDSYTQGACVPADQNLAAHLRARVPRTLNLGMLGNGPILELATMMEFLQAVKPKKVLWLYFRNDLSDLDLEKTGKLLRRYVDQDGFQTGLLDQQPAVDEALKVAISKLESEVAWWPRKAAAVGLTRRTSPVWIQDLVMDERNSSFAATLRLEHLIGRFMGGDPEGHSAGNAPDFALFKRVLAKAKKVAEGWGGTLTFVYLPDFWPPGAEGTKDHPGRAGVLDAVKEVGLPLIDVHEAFRGRKDLGGLAYYHQSHCNEAGYSAIAEAILARM